MPTPFPNPEFSLLTEWHDPSWSSHDQFLLEQVLAAIVSYVEEGYSGRGMGLLQGWIMRTALRWKGYGKDAAYVLHMMNQASAFHKKVFER